MHRLFMIHYPTLSLVYHILVYSSSTVNMAVKKDAPGMKGYRTRNLDGRLRDKRDDTYIKTIEKQYDKDFGVRDDMHLGTYLDQHGIASLNDLITGQ